MPKNAAQYMQRKKVIQSWICNVQRIVRYDRNSKSAASTLIIFDNLAVNEFNNT